MKDDNEKIAEVKAALVAVIREARYLLDDCEEVVNDSGETQYVVNSYNIDELGSELDRLEFLVDNGWTDRQYYVDNFLAWWLDNHIHEE